MSGPVEYVAGHKYRVTLHRLEKYTVEVCAVSESQAQKRASEIRFIEDRDPDDWELVHTDIETLRRIYETESEAEDWDLI